MTKSVKFGLLLIIIILINTPLALASTNASNEISWFFLIIGLLGGLALFLYGMEKMSEGLKKSAGDKMRNILAALTNNRVVGMFVGAFVTMVIQSSSATTVMLVSFVQSGLMTFVQSLGIILGANIGTTVTAQLVAFKLTDYAVLMIAVGFGLRFLSKKDNLQNIGDTILGFGLLFYGMKLMSVSMAPLREYPLFINALEGLENPFLGLLVGAIFTALIQSSSAFTGIVIVLAQQNLISLEAGIPLIIGANVGTSITAALASIGTAREAKRVAIAHTFFNIGGGLLFVFWIPYFAMLIESLGENFQFGVARNIANAHTIFNIISALVFLPFTAIIGKLIYKILPDQTQQSNVLPSIWHLDNQVIETPVIAVDLARAEISRMAKILGRMLDASIIPFTQKKIPSDDVFPQLSLIQGLDMREDKIDFLEKEVANYLIQIARNGLNKKQMNEVFGLITIVNDMASIGDIIHRNILTQIAEKNILSVDFSEEGRNELIKFHSKIAKQNHRIENVLATRNSLKAIKVLAKGEKYKLQEKKYRKNHFIRMNNENEGSIKTHEVHIELMDSFSQIEVYLENIAKTLVETSPKA